jgi:hypothetical protein
MNKKPANAKPATPRPGHLQPRKNPRGGLLPAVQKVRESSFRGG